LSEKFLTCLLVFSAEPGTIDDVIRETGAPSIAMGRTPHELRDEMCRRMPALRMPARRMPQGMPAVRG
jgi:hypothetical protein